MDLAGANRMGALRMKRLWQEKPGGIIRVAPPGA